MTEDRIHLVQRDALFFLKSLRDESVDLICTSPPYWQKRDYQNAGQLGQEKDYHAYIDRILEITLEAKRVLKPTGSFWLNIADSYGGGSRFNSAPNYIGQWTFSKEMKNSSTQDGSLLGIPQRIFIRMLDEQTWFSPNFVIWCLSRSTILYAKTATTEGPMAIHELVRLNPSTVQLWNGKEWTRVISWNRSIAESATVLVLRSGERIHCTPGHYWPLDNGKVVRAEELRVGDVLSVVRTPEPLEPCGPQDPDLAWFAGLYVAEGSMSNKVIQIAGNRHEVDRHTKLMRIVKKYGGSYYNGVDFHIGSVILLGVLEHFVSGKLAKGKRAHPRLFLCSNEILKAFLQGYLDGDGDWDAENQCWRLGFTRDNGLAADLRAICARLGFSLTLNPCCSEIKGIAKKFESYRGELRFGEPRLPRSEIVEILNEAKGGLDGFTEAVYFDVEVDREPHCFALASGILTHNSKGNHMPGPWLNRFTNAYEPFMWFVKSNKTRLWQDSKTFEWYWERPKIPQFVYEEAPGYYTKTGKTRRYLKQINYHGHAYFFDLEKIRVPQKYPDDVARRIRQDTLDGIIPFAKDNKDGVPWRRDLKRSDFSSEWEYRKYLWSVRRGQDVSMNFSKTKRYGGKFEGVGRDNSEVFGSPRARNERYDSKWDGVDTYHSDRQTRIARMRAKSREEAKLLFPDDPERQQKYVNYVHDHLPRMGKLTSEEYGSGVISPQKRAMIMGLQGGSALSNPRGKNPGDIFRSPTDQLKEAHFAPFPIRLIAPIFLACSPPPRAGHPSVVVDPFVGSGTCALLAELLGREFWGCDLNADYLKIAWKRIHILRTAAREIEAKTTPRVNLLMSYMNGMDKFLFPQQEESPDQKNVKYAFVQNE